MLFCCIDAGSRKFNSALFKYSTTLSQLLIVLDMNNVTLLMLSSDVGFFSPQAANTMQGCLVFVFLNRSLFFRCHRNILDKRGQRSGWCPRCRHSHHQRWGKPRARGRKERILHLDCRGSCAALAFSFPSFDLCTSYSLFPSPTFLVLLRPLAPIMSTRNPQAVHKQTSSQCVFLLFPSVETISVIYILSFIFSLVWGFFVCCFLLLADVFHWQLAVAAEVAPLSLPHLQHEYLEICKSTMTAP